jgi:ankyrin repeat domain-containing protein 17
MEEHSTQTQEGQTEISVPSSIRPCNDAEVSLDEMLSLACRQGKQDIVELLLESGANVNHRNKAGNTPLLEACSQGHVTIAQMLLDHSANIDAPTEPTSDSALTWACTLGNDSIVELLLKRGANVEHRTKDGCTALMFAALAGHVKVTGLLLENGAKINVESDSNKDSPLTFACWKGHRKVVQFLLEHEANLEHRTKEGFTPLMFAALGGHTDVANLLLDRGAAVNVPSGSNNDIPLTSACWKGHYKVVCLLLKYHSDIEHRTKDGCTPLMLAAREGHYNVAKLLLDSGAEVNVPSGSENNIPLTLACWKGHKDVVELLLERRSKIEHRNKAGCTPLMLAAREGHLDATKLLLDHGAQINVPSGSNDDTPLTLACWKGHTKVVHLLISKKSNIDHQTKTGCTPLMEATREGHVGVARLLLEAGANVETPDNYGQSPLFMACWKGHSEVAELLLKYSANKDCRTKTGITPLFQACRENHVIVVKLLLDYGCSVNSPFPNSRECPITLAAEKGHTDLVSLLLVRGCNIDSKTKKGCTPLYLACKEGHFEIVKLLHQNGSSLEEPDQRGITPLVAAFRSGHSHIVEWLLSHVSHLPSEAECHKSLMAPANDKEILLPLRSKCLDMIMKARRSREQAALKMAQNLCEEVDAEMEKKRKNAAKKRDKRKEKKRIQKELEKTRTQENVDEDEEMDEGDDSELTTQLAPPASPPSQSSAQKRGKKKRKAKKKTAPQGTSRVGEDDDEIEESQDDELFEDACSELPSAETDLHSLPHTGIGDDLVTDSREEEDQTPGDRSSGEMLKDDGDEEEEEEEEEDPVEDRSEGEWSVEDIDDIEGLEQQTDDNKLKSQSVTSQLPRVTSSVAVSTSATLTTVSASTSSRRDLSSTSPGFSWQEVGRTKVSLSISVPNNLIGRVIGVKGSKINSITESSGAQIHVAKPQGKATGRTVTIKGTPKAIGKAREMIEEALNHCDRDNTPPDSTATPPVRDVATTAQQPRPSTSWMLTPTTVSQSTSTITTMTSLSSVRGNTAAGVGEEPQLAPPPKTTWGNQIVSTSKPPLPVAVTTSVTMGTQPTMSTSTGSKVRLKKVTEVPKQEKQIPLSPPPSSTVSRPPQASTYSDVASGMKPKGQPSPVVFSSTQQPHPSHTHSPQHTPVDHQPPLGSVPASTQESPLRSPVSEETSPLPNLSAPTPSTPPHPAVPQSRQHHRSVSDPIGSQPSPQKQVVETASLDISTRAPHTMGSFSDKPSMSIDTKSPREDESKSLPSSSPLPLLGDSDYMNPPPQSGLLVQSEHPMSLSLPPSILLPTVMESPLMESKVGQFGPIGAPRHTSAYDGDSGSVQQGLGIPLPDTSKQKKSSYAGLVVEDKQDGSRHVYAPAEPLPRENSTLNPLAPEFTIDHRSLGQ